jgi:hypothetical protein
MMVKGPVLDPSDETLQRSQESNSTLIAVTQVEVFLTTAFASDAGNCELPSLECRGWPDEVSGPAIVKEEYPLTKTPKRRAESSRPPTSADLVASQAHVMERKI